MEQNRVKKGLELSAAITALVYCAIDLIIEVVDIIRIAQYIGQLLTAEIIIGLVIGIGLVITELILAILVLRMNLSTDETTHKKGLRIAFIVISGILVFFLLVSIIAESTSSLPIVALIVFIAVTALEAVAIALKDQVPVKATEPQAQQSVAATATETPKDLSLEEKIKELKHLLELGVITQEQYEAAVDKAVKQIM